MTTETAPCFSSDTKNSKYFNDQKATSVIDGYGAVQTGFGRVAVDL